MIFSVIGRFVFAIKVLLAIVFANDINADVPCHLWYFNLLKGWESMKKTMKRSLALGAIMAFVITGSAMAAEKTVNYVEFVEKAENKIIYVTENMVVNKGDSTKASLAGYTVNVTNGAKLTFNDVYNLSNTTSNGDIIITNTGATDTKNSNPAIKDGSTINSKNLIIKYKDDIGLNGRYDRVLSYVYGNVNITADETVYFETGDHTIHTEGADGKVIIGATDVIIKSDQRPIMNSGGADVFINATNKVVFDCVGGLYNWSAAQDGVISIKAKDIELYASGDGVIINGADGKVELNAENDLIIKSTNEKHNAIYLEQGGNVGTGDIILSAGGKTVVDGNIINDGVSDVIASFDKEESYLNGSVSTNSIGETNLSFSNGAKWNVTGDSKVTTLEGNNANIILSDINTKVEIGENKNTGVNVESTGALSDDNANDIQGMMDKLAGNVKIEAGITDKTVTAGEGLIVGETSAKYEGDKMVEGSLKEKENTVNGAISDAGAIGLMTWRNEMNDMNKRMGELRGNEAEHGVWVRMINGELEYEGLENDTKSYQLGYDEKLSTDPRWTVGVSLNYTEGDTSSDKVSAENNHKGFAVYGSKLNDDGSYLDLIAKYARLDHEFTVRGGDKGEWNANGYSVSAEYGKRFTQESGLWYEPQIELTYGRVGAADYVVGGRFVEQDKMDSLVGRVGFRIGKDTSKGNVYARASYLYDFDGESSVAFSDGVKATRTIEQDLGGGWFEVGIGANYKLSDATNLYLDVEKTFGGEVDVNWQWNAGVRYSF